MRDHDERLRALHRRSNADGQVVRVERREGLVEDDDLCFLEVRTREEDAAPLAMGELPPRLPDERHQLRGHPLEKGPEAELDTRLLGEREIARRGYFRITTSVFASP